VPRHAIPGQNYGNPTLNRTSVADPERVRQMFGAIARRYDLANHVLSCGLDFSWRKRAAEIVAEEKVGTIIDLATGTGDLALALKRRLPGARIIGADFSEPMLEIAKSKGLEETVVADAMRLPFADASADVVTIAFGLRNLPDWRGALREMARVLRPGGRLVVMEFSLPRPAVLRAFYRLYLHKLLPMVGAAITREKSAYDYLGRSIEEFPGGEQMLELLKEMGFDSARAKPLSAGVVTVYTARK
jgi:demethylmenaquinone methyltransferase/2-methoxy-6-polyprenyl-1,4-benzoquinol methylase